MLTLAPSYSPLLGEDEKANSRIRLSRRSDRSSRGLRTVVVVLTVLTVGSAVYACATYFSAPITKAAAKLADAVPQLSGTLTQMLTGDRMPGSGVEPLSWNGHLFATPAADLQPYAVHPIQTLIKDARQQWEQKVAKQSQTLRDAVDEYRWRHNRSPPKGFDKWCVHSIIITL